jgi:hypothetical protein
MQHKRRTMQPPGVVSAMPCSSNAMTCIKQQQPCMPAYATCTAPWCRARCSAVARHSALTPELTAPSAREPRVHRVPWQDSLPRASGLRGLSCLYVDESACSDSGREIHITSRAFARSTYLRVLTVGTALGAGYSRTLERTLGSAAWDVEREGANRPTVFGASRCGASAHE